MVAFLGHTLMQFRQPNAVTVNQVFFLQCGYFTQLPCIKDIGQGAVHGNIVTLLLLIKQAINDRALGSVCYTVFIPALTQP